MINGRGSFHPTEDASSTDDDDNLEEGVEISIEQHAARPGKRRRKRKSRSSCRKDLKMMALTFIFILGLFVGCVIVAILLTKKNDQPSPSISIPANNEKDQDNIFSFPSRAPTTANPSSNPSIVPPSYTPTTENPSSNPSIVSREPTTSNSPSLAPSSQSPSSYPSSKPSHPPSTSPSILPTASPTITYSPSQSASPSQLPTVSPSAMPSPLFFNRNVVLESRQRLNKGEFVSSPSGVYKVGLTSDGDMVLMDGEANMIWKANALRKGDYLWLQNDGNLILFDENDDKLWNTATPKNIGARFFIDDGGIISILYGSTIVWMQGIPRGQYTGPPSGSSMTFPIRGAFYYSWYPEVWYLKTGDKALFEPDLGWYHSGDPLVIEEHIDQFSYGNIDLGIVSWFGPDTNNDRARTTLLMEQTKALKANVKWAMYYEMMNKTRTEAEILDDLAYIKTWFAWHSAYAHIDGKPIVFVYQDSGCDKIEAFVRAAESNGGWYIVPKVFSDFEDCPVQPVPGSWHQYAPAKPVQKFKGLSYTISPGFWNAKEDQPRLPRLNETTWCNNVQDMVDSGLNLQLITTFNEAGEGTIIESSAKNWPSSSGYGYYLDCLHSIF